jgi:hypothetical protein
MKTLNVKSTADDLNAETILDTRTLALPDGVSVSRTALVCSQQLSLDEWQSLGRALTQIARRRGRKKNLVKSEYKYRKHPECPRPCCLTESNARTLATYRTPIKEPCAALTDAPSR